MITCRLTSGEGSDRRFSCRCSGTVVIICHHADVVFGVWVKVVQLATELIGDFKVLLRLILTVVVYPTKKSNVCIKPCKTNLYTRVYIMPMV